MSLFFLVTFAMLVLLGILGIASWLKTRQPNLRDSLGKLESVEGIIGLIGLIWGIVLLLRWISALGAFGYVPGLMLIMLVETLAIIGLSLILALPQLKGMLGSGDVTNKLGELTARLAPHKMVLGIVCLVFALYSLVSAGSMRIF
jgi:hypothetical protein